MALGFAYHEGVRRLYLLIIIGAVLSPLGWSQSVPISGFVIDQYGQPVVGAKVYICNAATSTGLPCTPPATIYQDFNLSSPIGNPTTTDANGDFNVYVGPLAFPNVYVVNAVPQAGTTYTLLYPGPSCPLSGCTFTGNVTAPIFNATLSPYYEVNGVQLASTNLLDTANIAYLNAANTFTGTPQTAPVFNATTGFDVGGVPLASTNLSDTANLAYLNASNTFIGATNTFAAITGTTINATSGFKVGRIALSASNLSNGVSGTGAICLASGSACGGSSPFAGTGIPYATSTTVSTVATSPQLVSALNNTPSTTLAVALLPLATTGAFGAVKPDGTTVTIVGGVIAANGTAGFTSGSNANGYWVKDPIGHIHQWGYITGSGSISTGHVVSFPVSFTITASITVNATSVTIFGDGIGFISIQSGTVPLRNSQLKSGPNPQRMASIGRQMGIDCAMKKILFWMIVVPIYVAFTAFCCWASL